MGTFISFLFGIFVVVGAVVLSTNSPTVFINYPSIVIVLGGTLAATFIAYEFKVIIKSFVLGLSAFTTHRDTARSLKHDIGQIVHWAYIIQKNGLQGLENEISEYTRTSEPFLTYGADLVVTGYTGAEVRQILEHSMTTKFEKENEQVSVLRKMAGDAPAFGMLGTLIGLVIMLGNMSADPSALGASMAIALITTFYGIILARMIFIPLATRLTERLDATMLKNSLQMEGLVLLAERKSPRYIQDRINSFVDPDQQFLIDRDMRDLRDFAMNTSTPTE